MWLRERCMPGMSIRGVGRRQWTESGLSMVSFYDGRLLLVSYHASESSAALSASGSHWPAVAAGSAAAAPAAGPGRGLPPPLRPREQPHTVISRPFRFWVRPGWPVAMGAWYPSRPVTLDTALPAANRIDTSTLTHELGSGARELARRASLARLSTRLWLPRTCSFRYLACNLDK